MTCVNILVAFLFTSSKFLHNGLFADDNRLILLSLVDPFHDGLLPVCESVDNHFEVVVILVMFLLYILDGLLYPQHFVVFFTDVDKLAVYPLSKFVFFEQKLAVVKWLISLYFCVVQLMLVLFAQSQLIVFLQVDLTLPLKLFKVLIQRGIHIAYSVDDYHYKDIIRTNSRSDNLVDVVSHSHQRTFEFLFILFAHADANSQF